ncbi:MAG TPA: ACT domain-containing protein [Candidatus Sulfotelmatobacter sp.]|nr:ACT domain-containing protein [Candidatus Sulfotelmatobacter sp.]
MTSRHALELLPGRLAICRLSARAPLPAWASAPSANLSSVTRTRDELSVVCEEALVPEDVARVERGWRAFRVHGPIPLTEIGVVAGITAPLAAAGISVFVVSTFDTDYVLVPAGSVEQASRAFEAAGHEVS